MSVVAAAAFLEAGAAVEARGQRAVEGSSQAGGAQNKERFRFRIRRGQQCREPGRFHNAGNGAGSGHWGGGGGSPVVAGFGVAEEDDGEQEGGGGWWCGDHGTGSFTAGPRGARRRARGAGAEADEILQRREAETVARTGGCTRALRSLTRSRAGAGKEGQAGS